MIYTLENQWLSVTSYKRLRHQPLSTVKWRVTNCGAGEAPSDGRQMSSA